MLTSLSVSAPGKIILHGEHSVVYGKKAVACAIGARVIVDADVHSESNCQLTINMPAVNLAGITVNHVILHTKVMKSEDTNDLMEVVEKTCDEALSKAVISNFSRVAVICLLYAYCRTLVQNSVDHKQSITVTIKSEIPVGAGLGSSAAFNTSVSCLFLLLSKNVDLPEKCEGFSKITNEADLKAINNMAFEMEKIVHQTPSGIDNTISTFGGALTFQSGNIRHIGSMPALQILIVDSKIPRSTKTLVSIVKDYLSSCPDIVSPMLDSMHAIACSAESLMQKLWENNCSQQCLEEWGRLIDTNQCLLSGLGVSHCAIDKVCAIAKKYGCPAKLTGAGGGGCSIVFLDYLKQDMSKISGLKDELIQEGFDCIKATLGASGVMVKSNLYISNKAET